MTREKAINVLKNEIRCVKSTSCLREECLNCTLTLPEHDILTALNMAIEALDSPTLMPGTSNLIRQAVKEATSKAYLTPEQLRQIDQLYREKCEELARYKAAIAEARKVQQDDKLYLHSYNQGWKGALELIEGAIKEVTE